MNIQELAKKAGMNVSLWDYGAGSIVFTMGTEGLARGALERFAALVLEEAAKVCDTRSKTEFPNTKTGLGFSFSQQWDAARSADSQCAASIRALKGAKE